MPFITIAPGTKRGDRVDLHGLAGSREFVSMNERTGTLTLKRKGFSENPGSRYSGLMSYYPAEFEVYRVVEHDSSLREHDLKVERLDSFEVRPRKETD